MNSPLGWFEVSGRRNVTTRKAREFAESSKMALATMLEFGLQRIFCAIKLSAKLVFLCNGILVTPFFDIGKWLFVLTLKSHLNNV